MRFWRLGYIFLSFDLSPLRIWRMLDDLLCVTCYPPNSDGLVYSVSLTYGFRYVPCVVDKATYYNCLSWSTRVVGSTYHYSE